MRITYRARQKQRRQFSRPEGTSPTGTALWDQRKISRISPELGKNMTQNSGAHEGGGLGGRFGTSSKPQYARAGYPRAAQSLGSPTRATRRIVIGANTTGSLALGSTLGGPSIRSSSSRMARRSPLRASSTSRSAILRANGCPSQSDCISRRISTTIDPVPAVRPSGLPETPLTH